MDMTEPGAISKYVGPDRFERMPSAPDTTVDIVVSARDAGADMFAGLVTIEPGVELDLHYHSQFELQYIVSGQGFALDSTGAETAVAAGGFVLSPAGRTGSHGFRATGSEPMQILFAYPSPGGEEPDRFPFDAATV
jgi:quercetin dioxygenase-like cupin family protein